MITRAKALEAWTLLVTYARVADEKWDGPHGAFDAATTTSVSEAYRTASRYTHPDVGGTAEAFARVDWAKHAMLKWLEQPNRQEAFTRVAKVPCPQCDGKGWYAGQNGFKMGVRQHCMRCQGTGDGNVEPERSDRN